MSPSGNLVLWPPVIPFTDFAVHDKVFVNLGTKEDDGYGLILSKGLRKLRRRRPVSHVYTSVD